MEQFGEELRKERESRGIALQTIIDATKISIRHLSALEENQFDRLPGGVFNRGIVRGYARVVGLDEETWVNRFMSAYQASGQVLHDDADWAKFAEDAVKGREGQMDRQTMRLRWAGVCLLMVLIGGLGWFVYHFVREKAALHDSRIAAPQSGAPSLQPQIIPSSLPLPSAERPDTKSGSI
jgi:cytoskeleton protein RodZ